MKTESITTQKVQIGVNYVLILLSSCGLSFCLANRFIFDKELSLPLFLISTIVFFRSMAPHINKKFSK